ncbi:hypothetical protein F4782DRAFT_46865 [Xylaria castorea]|nr:hypothetical protein F4782DRAFT_46865 [Xylaria castorea]
MESNTDTTMMTPTAEQAPVDDLGQQLMSLTINTRAPAGDHGTSEQYRPHRSENTSAHEVSWSIVTRRVLELGSEQRDRAIAIWRTLQIMQFERASQLHPQQSGDATRDQVTYEDISAFASKWLDRCRLDPREGLEILARDLTNLRKDVLDDFNRLYAQHLPYAPDLTRLLVLKGRSGSMQPYISAHDFDLDLNPNDPRVPWDGLMEARKQMVEAQFDVVEFLIAVSRPVGALPLQLSMDPDPSIVGGALEATRLIIRYLDRYSPELSKFLINVGDSLVLHSHTCKGPLDKQWRKDRVDDYLAVTDRVLRLIEYSIQDKGKKHCNTLSDRSTLLDRAALLTIRTIMLIHIHAKATPVGCCLGLLRESTDYTADAYTTYQGHAYVTYSHRKADEAMRELSTGDSMLLVLFFKNSFAQSVVDNEVKTF